ncbi:MAG: hypothetical protein E7032_07160 [Akkermansiaceae bacterium]|nr:hypothetical protein [Akkermansiaceae bacterium]
MARQMKDSGVEWMGEIPEEWEVARLKTRFFFGKGLPITKENLVPAGVPVVSYGQVHSKSNNGTALSNELFRFVDESYLATNPQSLVHRGDFIVADTSEDVEGCGNCVYVDSDLVLFAGYHTIILFDKEARDNKYFAYLFQSNEWRNQIRCKASGVKVFSISRKILSDAYCTVPPTAEQTAIFTYLDLKCAEIDKVVEQTRATIEEYKKLKQAIISEAVTKGVRGSRPMKPSGVEWIGDIPEEWMICSIKRGVSKVGSGKTPSGGAEVYLNEGVLFLRSQNIYDTGLQLDNATYISESTDEEMSGTRVFAGDVLLNITGASIGRCCVYPADMPSANVNQHVCIIRTVNSIFTADYMHYFWISFAGKTSIQLYQTGGNREGMSADAIKNTLIPRMDISEQQEIAAYLDTKCVEINRIIEKKEQLIEELGSYKKSLIYEYVTGKKEVTA